MARATWKMPDDFLNQISRLESRTDEIVPKVLAAGGEVVLEHVRVRLKAVLSGKSSGELARALGVSPARLDRRGNYDVKVGFAEPRRDGGSNAMLANILEHGKHNQPPRPFLKPAKIASREACIAKMKQVLESEIKR